MKQVINKGLLKSAIWGALMLIFLVGCSKDEDVIEPKLVLETESLSTSNLAADYSVDFLTNFPWQVSADVDWISFDTTSGDKGKQTFTFTVAENEGDERTGAITFTASAFTNQLVVLQEAGNRSDIYVKVNGSGDGYNWDRATTLDQALEQASGGNTIHIAEGVYIPTVTIAGGDESDPGDKTFEINKYITLIGAYPADATEGTQPDPSQYKTILSGDGTSYHVVTVAAPKLEGQKVTLEGLTITKGKAAGVATSASINGVDFRRDYGGGVIVGGAIVDVINTEVVDNQSDKFVAGFYAFGESVVTVKNSKFNHNISASNVGGFWINGSTAYIYDSEFIGNEGGTAAGVHAFPDANIYIYSSTIADNKGRSFGPGFYIRQNSKGVLANCLIYGNSSTGQHGGGVMMYNNNELTIISSTIVKNHANGAGGGVMKQSNTNVLNVYNSIISGNEQSVGNDIGENDEGPAPAFHSSAITSTVYDQNQAEITGATYDINSMMDESYLPAGTDNPVETYGMTAADLVQLGNGFDPALDPDVLSVDKSENSRTDVNIMGAFVAE